MKKKVMKFSILLVLLSALIACGENESKNDEKSDEKVEVNSDENSDVISDEDTDVEFDENSIEVYFLEASCFEGECDFVFEFEDGTPISFYKNFMDYDGIDIDYEFFNFDDFETNSYWVGKTFDIEYEVVKGGKLDIKTGELVDCNVITKIELK